MYNNNAALMKLATRWAVGTAFLLIAVKLFAWITTDSVSLLSSLVDSMMDAAVSIINLLAVRYALVPPDEDHKFGHHSAEDVAALGESAFIAGSALFVGVSALHRIIHPSPIQESDIGILVMVFSIIATFVLVLMQKYASKRTGSTVISADAVHYVSDLFMNLAIIAALLLDKYMGWDFADPILALLIVVYMLLSAYKIGKNAFDKLMDKEFDDEEKQKILDLIKDFPGALGIHDLKTRYSGIKPFIQLHLELDGSQTLTEAHEVADRLEQRIMDLFPGGEVIIHEDPVEEIKYDNQKRRELK